MTHTRKDLDAPLIVPSDVALATTEAMHIAMARVTSAKMADQIAVQLGHLACRLRPAKQQELETLYREMTGEPPNMLPAKEYAPATIATMIQIRMINARLGANPDWRPKEFEVVGLDQVAKDRASGKGAVFWHLPLEMVGNLVRMACRDAGWEIPIFYHWQHGPSRSRIGRATLGARDRRIEDQFGPRLMLRADDTQTAKAEAQAILQASGLVGIRGVGWANKPGVYPLFKGSMKLAFGGPSTAKRGNAALYLAIAGRTAKGFSLTFKRVEGLPERSYEDIGAEFARELEAGIRKSPSLWQVKTRQWTPTPVETEPQEQS